MFSKSSTNFLFKTPFHKTTLNSFNTSPSRTFIKNLGFKTRPSSHTLGMALTGIGAFGLGVMCYQASSLNSDNTRLMIASGQKVKSSIASDRMKKTLVYFSGGLVITSVMTAGMLRSPAIMSHAMSGSLIKAFASLGFTLFCQYQMSRATEPIPKHLSWLGFNAGISFLIVPLIAMSELMIVRDAFLLTSGVFGGLGLTSYFSRDDAFLSMAPYLGAGLGAITAVGLANMFLKSNALGNIWLYGGLFLFVALTLYEIKELENSAKRNPYFDPMKQSIGLYLDFVNIFIRLLIIMSNNKKK